MINIMLYKNYFNKFTLACASVFQKQLGFIMTVFLLSYITQAYTLLYAKKISLIIYAFSVFFTSFCLGYIVNLISNSFLVKLVKFLSISILSILFLLEAFLLYSYKVLIGPKIINVMLETNIRESLEFLNAYINATMIGFVFLLFFLGYVLRKLLRRYINQIPSVKIQNTLAIILIIGLLFTIRGICSYRGLYLESFMFPRFCISTAETVHNINEYKRLYSMAKANSNATITENKSTIKNIVFIVGESTNRNHMGIYNYYNNTTPNLKRLQENGDLFVFKDVVSPHSHTIPVMGKLFTFCNYESKKPWYNYNNLVSILKLAGYNTYWLSNQESSGVWGNVGQVFANLSDNKAFTRYRDSQEYYSVYDEELLRILDKGIEDKAEKNFFVLHLMGTHNEYNKRYPREYDIFHAQDIKSQFGPMQKDTIAEYDNAIVYNDFIIHQIIRRFENEEAIIIFVSDHGEEVYDFRDFAGHNEDNGSRYMIEVPMVIWTSKEFNKKYQTKINSIKGSLEKQYMTDDMIHTILDLADIRTPEYDESRSIINANFNAGRKRIYHDHDYDSEWKK